MKRTLLLLITVLLVGNVQPAFSQKALSDSARMAWWKEARFGLFIHWGIYFCSWPVPMTGNKYPVLVNGS